MAETGRFQRDEEFEIMGNARHDILISLIEEGREFLRSFRLLVGVSGEIFYFASLIPLLPASETRAGRNALVDVFIWWITLFSDIVIITLHKLDEPFMCYRAKSWRRWDLI
jgi:hypothetical protein